mmetsp:Transcript_3987/g.10501  ORF Transcript_3987/g.10501 Transcript_3987/m.10501 type:complete len:301 (+) Transcript_3987:306-1208(+)
MLQHRHVRRRETEGGDAEAEHRGEGDTREDRLQRNLQVRPDENLQRERGDEACNARHPLRRGALLHPEQVANRISCTGLGLRGRKCVDRCGTEGERVEQTQEGEDVHDHEMAVVPRADAVATERAVVIHPENASTARPAVVRPLGPRRLALFAECRLGRLPLWSGRRYRQSLSAIDYELPPPRRDSSRVGPMSLMVAPQPQHPDGVEKNPEHWHERGLAHRRQNPFQEDGVVGEALIEEYQDADAHRRLRGPVQGPRRHTLWLSMPLRRTALRHCSLRGAAKWGGAAAPTVCYSKRPDMA